MTANRRTQTIILGFIMMFGVITRFAGLTWGNGFFFHPDENNMAVAITRLTPADAFKPTFFAYGQFPLYLAYGSYQVITNTVLFFKSGLTGGAFFKPIPFSDAIYYLRFFSALASVATMVVIYHMSKLFFSSVATRALVLLFVAATPGLIQIAHFGTTESILTFLFMATLYVSLKLIATKGQSFCGYFSLILPVMLLGFLVGLAASVKLTGLYCAIPAVLGMIYFFRKKPMTIIISGCIFLEAAIGAYIFASPYNLLAKNEFVTTLRYETAVATGTAQVFYTRQFENTIPILFQIRKIFPYALGIPIFAFGILGIGISLGQPARQSLALASAGGLVMRAMRNSLTATDKKIAVILFAFFFYLIPNSFLFAKWSRFMAPIFPLFAIFAGFVLERLLVTKTLSIIKTIMVGSFITVQLFFGLLFFSMYVRDDTRTQSSKWMYQNMQDNSYILSETANVVDIPVSSIKYQVSSIKNYQVISFDFYHLDENPKLADDLVTHLEKADYIFIPSRRIFTNHLRLPKKYPLVNRYYQALFDGRLGFEKVAEFSSFPKLEFGIWNWEFDDERSEETFTVFDHPVVRIYKKVQPFDASYYRKLLL